MKTLFLVFIFFAVQVLAQENLVLSLGERKALPLSNAANVWIENKQILTAAVDGNSLVLKPQKIGTSLIRLQGRTQQVQIVNPLQFQSYARLKENCTRLLGLAVEFHRGILGLQGTLYRLADWRKIAGLHLNYVMKAQVGNSMQDEAQAYFNGLMRKAKLPRQTLIFSDQVEIRIHPKSIFREKYEELFSSYGVQVVLDPESLETAPTIKVQITVAEVRRDLRIQYGLKWPSSYSATILHTGKRELDDFPFTATALESQGMAKILASPNIICRSGKEAEFLAGGEFPIKIMNYKIQDIIWKKYGILLKVQPRADSSGRMSISIETEVSSLDDSRKVDGIPGILTNHVSSHFDLSRPQTIALSGLIKNEDSSSHEGLPFLSRLPILGALFSSKDFKENRSELVIFVRPSILDDEEDIGTDGAKHIGDLK
jgi:pilus assembly protein CpaC